jgi:hypothetical protein
MRVHLDVDQIRRVKKRNHRAFTNRPQHCLFAEQQIEEAAGRRAGQPGDQHRYLSVT